jgi:hypothetical protein
VAVTAALSSLASRRGAIIAAALLALAAAVGIAVFRPGMMPNGSNPFGSNVAQQVGNGVDRLKAIGNTVAGIFGSRSPGERVGGVLASLKPRKQAAIHERALPKMRGPVSPLAGIVAAPVIPPIAAAPPETPLYNVVNGTPTPVATVAATPLPGGAPPIVFPGITPLPGGGGGIIFPPVVETPPVIPPVIPPTTPGVPEPATWAMMLIGFGMIGRTLRRRLTPVATPVPR